MKRWFSSVKLTIVLLILLAALSVVGTLIPQNAPPEQYKRIYSPGTYRVLEALGLFDMYHSWWFLGLLGLLVLNIVVCSAGRLPRLRSIKDPRWRLSRIGVYVTHLSILVILFGGMVSGLFGFRGVIKIEEGGTSDLVIVGGKGAFRLPFRVRCDDFEVSFWPDGTPKDYVSRLTFLEGDKVLMEGVQLRVNHPVELKGFTFYQASYGRVHKDRVKLSLKVAEKERELVLTPGHFAPLPSGGRLGLMKYAEDVHGTGPGAFVVVFPLEGDPMGVWLLERDPKRRMWKGEGFSVALLGVENHYWTGLEVARDPGVWIVWTGSSTLMVGLFMAFWFRRDGQKEG